MFKTRLDTFGNDFRLFWNFENSLFFWKFSKTRPPMENWAKVFRKNCPKTRSELVWILLGTILGIFGILNIFWFFWKFSRTRPSMESWAKIFRKNRHKTCSKHIWTLWGTILGIFGFLRLFRLFSKFKRLEPPWETGQKFFEKFAPKYVQNTFAYFW